MRFPLAFRLALAGLLAGGCAAPQPTDPASASEAAEEARRAERLKFMQEYWSDRTGSDPDEAGPDGGAGRLLDYPAGDYGGIRFAARRAADPSLGEPRR